MPKKVASRKHLTRQEKRDLDIEIGFLEGIVSRDPAYVDALQLLGGRGVVAGNPVEQLYREIRSLRIYEGTTEVQQLVIAAQVLDAYAKKDAVDA